jgi:AcrR family transcriptional regulator
VSFVTTTPTADGRRARGDVTRKRVAREAAMIATVSGLDSITVGLLAERTGVSKSGILTVFGNREAIQVAAVAEARRIYQEIVVGPAWSKPPGAERLRALLESWVDYLRAGVFPGGCFIAATSVEYGHRQGQVADAV